MEGPANIQLITIFLSSHILENVNIDLYDTDDTELQNLHISNYSYGTIQLNKNVQTFYCVVSNPANCIQEQFQCDFKQLLKEQQKPTLQKEFDLFKLSVTVQFKEQREYQDAQKVDDYLANLALNHLKRMQKKILKKMELDELKKPIKLKCRFAVKNSDVPKTKINVGFSGVDKIRISSQKKLVKRNSKRLQTTKLVQGQAQPQSTQKEQKNQQNSEEKDDETRVKRGTGKHKTLVYKARKIFNQMSTKQISVKENKNEDLPMYDLILKLFNSSLNQHKKMAKSHRNRAIRISYNDLLQSATQRELQMQNEVLSGIQSSTDYAWFTASHNKVGQKMVRGAKVSPYKANSIPFRKRKIC